jgi:putative transposase
MSEADYAELVTAAHRTLKSSLGNLATCTIDQLAAIIRNRLGRIQRQPALITALLGQTGLTLESQPP